VQKLILGTHTSENEQNYLMIAEVQVRSTRTIPPRLTARSSPPHTAIPHRTHPPFFLSFSFTGTVLFTAPTRGGVVATSRAVAAASDTLP